MTLQEYQDILHSLYQGDTDTPSSGDATWNFRNNLLKAAIALWASDRGMVWSDLFVMLSTASNGDKTVVADTLSYDCPTNFRSLGGFVRTYSAGGASTYWQIVKPEQSELLLSQGVKACFVAGNKKTGYTINFLTQPTPGDTIEYPYYKTPFEPSTVSDVIEMSDPYFAIYFSLSKMHEIDGDGDRAIKAFNEANERLSGMKMANEMSPAYQENSVPDRDWETGSGGFGE